MNKLECVQRLGDFVRRLDADGVVSRAEWHVWRKDPAKIALMSDLFGYVQERGMPTITSLMTPDFHAEYPLVLLNYSQIAHLTLHSFANGWVPTLRCCRGTVIERTGKLVAFSFEKFFNHGEMKSEAIPQGPFEATLKADGHLIAIFRYQNRLLGTTRGSFTSKTSVLANRLLRKYNRPWKNKLPEWLTVNTEFIHPQTHVIVDYGDLVEFRINGATDIRTCRTYRHDELLALGQDLGLPVVERLPFDSFKKAVEFAEYPEYRNIEGLVLLWGDGTRLKVKCMPYVSIMIGSKLNHIKVMNLLMAGGFEKKLKGLDGEIQVRAEQMRDEVLKTVTVGGGKQACWEYLYGLLPEDSRTDYYKGICRKFYRWLVSTGQIVEETPAKPKRSPRKTSATATKAKTGKAARKTKAA
jgi:hypothetical protein